MWPGTYFGHMSSDVVGRRRNLQELMFCSPPPLSSIFWFPLSQSCKSILHTPQEHYWTIIGTNIFSKQTPQQKLQPYRRGLPWLSGQSSGQSAIVRANQGNIFTDFAWCNDNAILSNRIFDFRFTQNSWVIGFLIFVLLRTQLTLLGWRSQMSRGDILSLIGLYYS